MSDYLYAPTAFESAVREAELKAEELKTVIDKLVEKAIHDVSDLRRAQAALEVSQSLTICSSPSRI